MSINLYMHITESVSLPGLSWTLSIVLCTSLLCGISFHVARNTLRSEWGVGRREDGYHYLKLSFLVTIYTRLFPGKERI